MGDRLLAQGYALDRLDQTDALGKLAPGNEHGMMGEFVGLVVAHGSPPHKAAESVAEQGSVVKVQVIAEKSNSAPDCTKLTLEPGDVLLLYTDGVTEAMDAHGRLFGTMRLEAAVAASTGAGAGARQIVEDVIAAVRGFAGPGFQSDDIALVVVKRCPLCPRQKILPINN